MTYMADTMGFTRTTEWPKAHVGDIEELDATVSTWLDGDHESLTPPPWVFARPLPSRTWGEDVAILMGVYLASGEAWRVRAILRTHRTGATLEQITVQGWNGISDVTGSVLRALPVAEIRNLAVGHLGIAQTAMEAMRKVDQPQDLRRGRKGYPDDHYARLALRYLLIISEGRGRGVLRQLAEEFGVPYQTIRSQLRRCVELGFLLPSTKQGRAESRPGPRLASQRGAPNE